MQSIPRHPIVDTGPLFDYLLWRFSDSIRNISAQLTYNLIAKLIYLTDDPSKKSLQWYFSVAKPITTSPHVISEIHRHAEQALRGLYLKNFWQFAQKELKDLGLDEKLVELVHMNGETLSFFGPTDTALLQIAANSHTQSIFTEDTRLAGQCRKREVNVLSITQATTLWKEYGSR